MEENLQNALEAHYSLWLVVLSIAVACVASYAALRVADRISASDEPKLQRNWMTAGSVVMGIGGWAMHFIAMLALKLPIAVSYDILVTILSTLPAILASGVMLYVISRPKIKKVKLFVGGTLMGAGIGAMHYVGMAAMSGVGQQIVMMYDPKLFAVSVIVAIVLANAALYINSLVDRKNGGGPPLVQAPIRHCHGLRRFRHALHGHGRHLFLSGGFGARHGRSCAGSRLAGALGLLCLGPGHLAGNLYHRSSIAVCNR